MPVTRTFRFFYAKCYRTPTVIFTSNVRLYRRSVRWMSPNERSSSGRGCKRKSPVVGLVFIAQVSPAVHTHACSWRTLLDSWIEYLASYLRRPLDLNNPSAWWMFMVLIWIGLWVTYHYRVMERPTFSEPLWEVFF